MFTFTQCPKGRRHPAPGCANFGRDFFRGSVFVIMTILRGATIFQIPTEMLCPWAKALPNCPMSSGALKVFEWLVIFFEVLTNKKTKALLFILEIKSWRLWGQKVTLECFCNPFQYFFICFLSLFTVRIFKTWELDQIWSVYRFEWDGPPLLLMCKSFCKGAWTHRSPSKSTRHKAFHMHRMPGIPSWKGSTQKPHETAHEKRKVSIPSHLHIVPLWNKVWT